MKVFYLSFILAICFFYTKADRIYIMNGGGYNQSEPQLVAAITANGHTVVVNSTTLNALPAGFTTRCVDPVNGYDWLCFFGEYTFSGLLPQIQAFIDLGGKVYYQYEVSCCTLSSSSAAAVVSGLTGLGVTPNFNSYIALGGWNTSFIGCCDSFKGNAYKSLDGMPLANQLLATSNVGATSPPISTSLNFGFEFATTNFVGVAHHGGIVGIGDVNIWYDGAEPFSNGGTTPVNTALIDFIFPNNSSPCYMFPPGCLLNYSGMVTGGIVAVNLGNDTTLCPGTPLTLNANNPGATYLWQNGSTNQTFQVTTTGTYWVHVTTSCGSGTDTIHVNYANIPPDINLGNDTTLCTGQSFNLNATTFGATYLWQDNTTAATYHVTQAGTYWVQVTTNCGTSVDTIHVSYMSPPPPVNLGNDTTFCQGQTLKLNATTPGASYTWQDNSNSATFTVNQTGTYWVQVNTSCGSSSDTIHVTVISSPSVNIGNDTSLCKGQSLTLNATTSTTNYLWQDGSSNSMLTVTQTGLYWVEVELNNCKTRDSVFVTFNDVPVVNLGPDRSLCPGDYVNLDASTPNATYLWQDHSIGYGFHVIKEGNYHVDVTVNNCTGSDDVYVDFLQQNCECKVYVPNAFSPNRDLKNDELKIINGYGIELKEFIIYNRWGNEVYNSQSVELGWDGFYKGVEADQGTYFYLLRYVCNHSGKEYLLKGDITLLR